MDNGSIYTKNLINFLSKQKTEYEICDVGRTLVRDFAKDSTESYLQRFDSFILTGRKENNRIMNKANSEIIKHAISEKKQLLGICYGAEILNQTLNGTIKKYNERIYGEETVIVEKKNKICQNEIRVFESHRWGISQLGKELHICMIWNWLNNEVDFLIVIFHTYGFQIRRFRFGKFYFSFQQ